MLLTTFDLDAHIKNEKRYSYEDGKAEGRTEGKIAESQAKIFQTLNLKFGDVSPELCNRINAETDSAILDSWFTTAITATSLEDFVSNM